MNKDPSNGCLHKHYIFIKEESVYLSKYVVLPVAMSANKREINCI